MIIDCIGCLHGFHPKLEGGDLLIVTGDLTKRDSQNEVDKFDKWLDSQPYRKKIFIAGNHDNCLVKKKPRQYMLEFGQNKRERFEYLCDSGTEFEGLKIWGCPWSKSFPGINPKCTAFNYLDEEWFYDEKVSKIPHDTDILITHAPAAGILDGIPIEDGSLFHSGSIALGVWLKYVERPQLHVFSHIHEAYGETEVLSTYNGKMMKSVNCSIMTANYKPTNKPIRVIL